MAIDFDKAMRPNLYQLMQSGEVIANALQGNIANSTTENFSLEYQEGDVTNRLELAEGGKLYRLDGMKTEMVNVNGQGIEISSTDTAEEPDALPIQIDGDGLVSVTGSPLVLDGLGEPTSKTQATSKSYVDGQLAIQSMQDVPVNVTLYPVTSDTSPQRIRLDLPASLGGIYRVLYVPTVSFKDANGNSFPAMIVRDVASTSRKRVELMCCALGSESKVAASISVNVVLCKNLYQLPPQ